MNTKKIRNFMSLLSLMILVMLISGCGVPVAASPGTQAAITSPEIAEIIDKYRDQIQQDMQTRGIPGLAIAVVDDQRILWEEGFGYTDWDLRTPVTPATLFSIQSVSKSFTATATMIAAQEGLVDLDAPITTYLPDFTVDSIFEKHPEQKMTLRILLSHTAGFPHDTGYGGDADGKYGAPPYSFEKHIASIAESGLMFPVGTHYNYSNVGIDLAGYILQVRSGMPFVQYVQQKVFDPLGMKDSMLDYLEVRADASRAIGHFDSPLRPPVDFQLLPSGGVWSSAEDMARYLQFHINKGTLDGKRLLREDLAETMYIPPNQAALGAYGNTDYALGVTVDNYNNTRHFQHGGGGYGFNTSLVWYPDLKLGSVVFINYEQPDGYVVDLSEGVLESIMMTNIPLYHQRSISATQVSPAYPPDTKDEVLTNDALRKLIASKALPEDAAARQRRSEAVGLYIVTYRGLPSDTFEIGEIDGRLSWTYHGNLDFKEKETLTEVQPDLYLSNSGNLVDMRGPVWLIDNVRLIKAKPQGKAFWMAFYALCGLVFLSALFFWPARSILRKLRQKDNANQPAILVPASRWTMGTSILAALTAFFGLICIAFIFIIPNLIYVPWPKPIVDLVWWQYALIGLPFACLVAAVGVILLAVQALRRSAPAGTTGWYFLVIGLVQVAFYTLILL